MPGLSSLVNPSRAVCLTSTPQWRRAKPRELGEECVVKKAEFTSAPGRLEGNLGLR